MAPNRGGQGKEPSISSGGASSEGSSHGSDASIGVLKDQEAGDLLRGSTASKKEVLFPSIYFLFDNRILERDVRFLVLHTLFTWAQLLNLFFGPNFFGWDIDWNGNNWWRFYKLLLLSNAVVERGWSVYVGTLVVFIVAYVGSAAVCTWLTFALKTRTKFRWKWPAHLLRTIVTLCWGSFLTSFISLLTVAYTCNNDSSHTMFYFPSRGCFDMPQVVLFAIGLVVTLLCVMPALHSLLIDCGDTNFRSSNYFSTSVGSYIMRMGLVKMFLPLVPMMFQLFPRWHGVFNASLTSYLLYISVRRVPLHHAWLNCAHAFLNSFFWWAAALGLLGIYYPQYWHGLTIAFLAGMVPVGLGFAAIAHYRQRRMWQVAQLFAAWTPQTPLRETHRFWDEYEVELVARVCCQTVVTEVLDVVPDPRWTDLADRALQAGLAQFPDSAFLNVVYASLQAVLLNDPSGGMAQLQKARKCADITWVQRFQVYVREQTKLAQKGRDQDQSSTFDAVTWAEFQSNYKLAIRTHRGALTSLKSFWHLLLRSDVSMVSLVRHFLRIESSREAAERSYKAVMERYPNNPRVLRAYARFLQQVKNDPNGSSRYNALADKVEEQQDESRRELIFSQILDRKFKDEASTKAMAMIDETTDAVIMINQEGMTQHANTPALKMFGYRKGELEGKNISMLMPSPFSQQHDSYLRNYMTTRRPRILDTTREVVALHKQRHVFPVSLCVTPIMMGAAECFMGVLKQLEDEANMATAYCTANGTVVCINRGFSNLFAWQSTDVIGHAFHDYTPQHEKFNQIIAAVTASDGQEKTFGKLTIMHKFGEEVDVEVQGRRAGTDAVRITVLELTATANKFTGLITVSPATARITYTNASFCELVGISADHLIKMRLHEIMPEPYAMLHQRWIKGRDLSRAPGLKCRAGRVVEFKHSSGKLVPAVLELGERSTDAGNMFTVKVAPIKEKEQAEAEWNRISLTVTPGAVIDSHVGNLSLFGLDRETLVGKSLDALLDLYRKEGVEPASIHTSLLVDLKDNPRTLRVAVAPRGKRTVPAVMQLLPPAEEGGQTTMHLYRADCLEGVIELDAACKVKKCSEEATLLFGLPASELVGDHIHKVLPKVCPQGKTSELLAVRGQRGGVKRSIGVVVAAEAVHPDKRPLHVSLQAAESTERPGRYLVRIIVPKPTSSYSTAGGRPGTGVAPSQLPGGLSVSGAGPTGAGAKPSLLGSLTGFIPGMGGSPPATGGGCPFHFGSAGPAAEEADADALAGTAAAVARPVSPSRPTTGGGCPFGFGSRGSGPASRDPSTAAAVASRPVTGGSACPINLNTEEVLSSLSFPPTSRFALQKAHAEAAVAASAERSRQATATEDDGRDPNLDGGAGRDAGLLPEASLPNEDSTAVLVRARPAGIQDAGADAGGAPNHESEQHSGSEQEGEEGGEEEMDPEELAKKMALVHQWLQDTAAPEAAAGVPASAGPPGTAASRPRTGVSAAAAGATVLELPAAAAAAAEGGGKELVALGGDEGRALVASKSAGAAVKAADQMAAETSSQPDSDAASMVTDDNDEGADYSRLKRYRKAYKLLNSARARRAINNLQAQLKYVLAGLVLVHVACFATSLIVLNSSLAYINNVDLAGVAARNAISMCTDMRIIQWASQEIKQTGSWHFGDPYVAAHNLAAKAAVLEQYQNDLYFSKGSAAAATADIYDNTMLENLVYIDVNPAPREVLMNMSLWDSTQRLINAAKDVAAMSLEDWFDVRTSMSYRFAMDNAPNTISERLLKVVDMEAYMAVQKLKQVGMVTWVLLGIEAGLVIPLCALYIYRLLRQVAVERFNLFSIFLFIPRPALLALARAEVVVDELDESSDDDDELAAITGGGAGAGGGGGATAVNTAATARALAQKAAQNKLAISRRAILWLMLPFAVWLAVAAACWGLQFYWVDSASARVMGLDASERAFVYNARVRFYSTQLAVKADGKTTDDDESMDLRSRLSQAAARLQFWHENILYGDDSVYRPLDQKAHNLARVNYPKLHFVSTMYSNLQRSKLLYDEQCLKPNVTKCYSKDDTLYQTTNFGLNNMVYYYVEQAKGLAMEDIVAIVSTHPSAKYILEVGVEDMLGGWTESNRIFMYIANFTYTRALQGVVLAFVIVGALGFQYFQARPYLRTTQLESKKVAEVVSYCPQGVDVAALMEQACVSADAGGGGGGRSLQRSLSKSSDQEFA